MTFETTNGWMRGLGLGAALGLLGLGSFLQGCGSGSPGSPCPGASAIQSSWDIFQNGQPVECFPGDTVTIRVDNDAMIQPFDCSDHTGITPPVDGGVTHRVSYALFDGSGNVLQQTPNMSLYVPCGVTQITPDVEFDL
jgi:hypothetical protein